MESLVCILHNRKVPISNLNLMTVYGVRIFVAFFILSSLVPLACTEVGHGHLTLYPLNFIIH